MKAGDGEADGKAKDEKAEDGDGGWRSGGKASASLGVARSQSSIWARIDVRWAEIDVR